MSLVYYGISGKRRRLGVSSPTGALVGHGVIFVFWLFLLRCSRPLTREHKVLVQPRSPSSTHEKLLKIMSRHFGSISGQFGPIGSISDQFVLDCVSFFASAFLLDFANAPREIPKSMHCQ